MLEGRSIDYQYIRYRNWKAKKNGCEIEDKIAERFNVEINRNALFDFYINDIPFEIKSCQEYVKDSSHSNGRRSGRFKLNHYQHAKLQQQNGFYVFVVKTADAGLMIRIIPAREIKYRDRICWKKIFKSQM